MEGEGDDDSKERKRKLGLMWLQIELDSLASLKQLANRYCLLFPVSVTFLQG